MPEPTIQPSPYPSPVGVTPLSGSGRPTILMCAPDYFKVTYAINPWMEGKTVDVDLAKRQWEALYEAVTRRAGADVLLLPPVADLPDLVFTANAAFVYRNQAVIAHYKHPERQPEEPHCEAWFRAQGFEVTVLPRDISFEGAGDALTWENRVIFAGYGTRTDRRSHAVLAEVSGLEVVSLELRDPRFYHIDVCLCPLADGHLIYTPDALTTEGLTALEAVVPGDKRIPVTREEAGRFACNAINVHKTVIFNAGSDRLAETLKDRGFEVIQTDLSEFLKAGGSAKCLSLRVA